MKVDDQAGPAKRAVLVVSPSHRRPEAKLALAEAGQLLVAVHERRQAQRRGKR